MKVDSYTFDLPEKLIAINPVKPRDASKLLIVKGKTIKNDLISNVSKYIGNKDIIIFNDTKVIKSRLYSYLLMKEKRISIELLLTKKVETFIWDAMAKPTKKIRKGDKLFLKYGYIIVLKKLDTGLIRCQFKVSTGSIEQLLEKCGEVPLPPYIVSRRNLLASDEKDYQTIYAKREGSIAAPTAGLHFSKSLINRLEKKGALTGMVTLHIGLGTFLPIRVRNIKDHQMHEEYGEVTKEMARKINKAKKNGGKIIAVGTSTLRLLEQATKRGRVRAFKGETKLFIYPGYKFKLIDGLITNFHLPKSTLFILVAAFCGLSIIKNAYNCAIKKGYRFYSYGDASLLMRN